MNITVIGLGYVGLSQALLFSRKNRVFAYDSDHFKIVQLKSGKSPIDEPLVIDELKKENCNLIFTDELEKAITLSDYAFICVPTNFSEEKMAFDTTILETVLHQVFRLKKSIKAVIKSTVPVGFTTRLKQQLKTENIVFSPEFLREGNSLEDSLYPSRIVIGDRSFECMAIYQLYAKNCLADHIPVCYVSSEEAEAIKLFSNTYLAMRVAYFNELDTFAEIHGLSSQRIIQGIGLDSRIGNNYNNPSFGYGGYCLPKDSKQLQAHYHDTPQNLISAIIAANQTRKTFIIQQILQKKPKTIGIYRLNMKQNSDNCRNSVMIDLVKQINLANPKLQLYIYEPLLKEQNSFLGNEVVSSIDLLKRKSEVILANRMNQELLDVIEKVYSRDLFHEN